MIPGFRCSATPGVASGTTHVIHVDRSLKCTTKKSVAVCLPTLCVIKDVGVGKATSTAVCDSTTVASEVRLITRGWPGEIPSTSPRAISTGSGNPAATLWLGILRLSIASGLEREVLKSSSNPDHLFQLLSWCIHAGRDAAGNALESRQIRSSCLKQASQLIGDYSLPRLRGRRLSLSDLRQLAIREEPTNDPDGHPPPATLLARRLPQMPRLVGPGQHIHFQQLLVVRNVANPRPLPLYKPRPGVPAPDRNGVAGGVRNHKPGRVFSAAKQFPDVP